MIDCDCGWDDDFDERAVMDGYKSCYLYMPISPFREWELMIRVIYPERSQVAYWRLPRNWCLIQI